MKSISSAGPKPYQNGMGNYDNCIIGFRTLLTVLEMGHG